MKGLTEAATRILLGEQTQETEVEQPEEYVVPEDEVQQQDDADLEQEDLEENVQEVVTTEYDIELQESYTFGDYLTVAKELYGEEEAIDIANAQFNAAALDIFAEQVSRKSVDQQVNMYHKQGHKVSIPKMGVKDGKMFGSYVVTHKDTGVRRKYTHIGNMKRVENLGAPTKTDVGKD